MTVAQNFIKKMCIQASILNLSIRLSGSEITHACV